jgi:hypothetical protein
MADNNTGSGGDLTVQLVAARETIRMEECKGTKSSVMPFTYSQAEPSESHHYYSDTVHRLT